MWQERHAVYNHTNRRTSYFATKILNAAVHTSTSRILCLTAGEIALGNTSSAGVKRDRVPKGLTSYCSIDHKLCFLQYIASPSRTLLPVNFYSANVNCAAITSQINENHLIVKKKLKLFQIIHSLTILISTTDQWRHGPNSQYINFWIHFHKFHMFISTRLSDSVLVYWMNNGMKLQLPLRFAKSTTKIRVLLATAQVWQTLKCCSHMK